jgi:hypothetical protein
MVHHHVHDHSPYVCESNHCHGEEKAAFIISIPNHAHCYICDFKFPVNDLPTVCEVGFVSNHFNELQPILLISPDLTWGYSRVNPRAPPAVS